MKPIIDILNTPLTKPKEVIEGTHLLYVPRSGWSTFFKVFGCLGILIAGIALLVCVVDTNSYGQTGNGSVILIIAGVIIAIQSFFLSFLINVFTDMRWLLAEIRGKMKSD